MGLAKLAIVASLLIGFAAVHAAAADDESEVRAADAQFWQAYNACDMKALGDLLTADIEFYHDKTGLTSSRQAVVESLRKGPCADPRKRLRREAVAEGVKFHPLSGGFAILSAASTAFMCKKPARPSISMGKPNSHTSGSSQTAAGACVVC